MNAGSEDTCFGEDGHPTYTVQFHLDIGVAVGISKVRKMRTPGSIFGVAFDNDCIFVKCFGKPQSGF